jgi:MFS family permease
LKKRVTAATVSNDEISVARNRSFNLLWGSQILSQIASNLLNFALIIRVFELAAGTRFANISVALLVLSFGLPALVLSAAAGVYVDHLNKKHVLLIINFARALLALLFLLVDTNLWLVLTVSFAFSSATQFFAPAESAAIPALVGKRQLLRANSLFVFTLYASFIVGYSASGPIISWFGSAGPYLATSVMLLLAGLLTLGLPDLRAEQPAKLHWRRLWHYTQEELRRNWRAISTSHHLGFPITQLTLGQGVLSVIIAMAPALALSLLGLPLSASSHYLIMPAGAGLVTGVILAGRLTQLGKTKIIAISLPVAATMLLTIGLLGAHLADNPERHTLAHATGLMIAALVYGLGLCNAVVSVAAQTMLQEHTQNAERGRVFGALGLFMNLAATVPVFVVGALADLTTPPAVIAGTGALLLGFGITQFIYLWRQRLLQA